MHTRRPVLAGVLLAALVLAGCGGSSDGGSASERTTTSAPATTTATADGADDYTPTQLPGTGADTLAFRPVLSSDTCAAAPSGPSGTETLRSSDGTVCYQVGPMGATAADLAEAEPTQDSEDQNRWTVLVTPSPAGATRLNTLFDACFHGDASCPPQAGRGSVAIVFQGEVVSAPMVNAPGLADQPFVISGEFTEQQAQALADLINR